MSPGTLTRERPSAPLPLGMMRLGLFWRGKLASARTRTDNRNVTRVMLWSAHHAVRALPDGSSVCDAQDRCQGGPAQGEVEGLDLNADVVSFVRSIVAPGIAGHVNWEIRVDDLANAHTGLAGGGVDGEACVGGGLEVSRPQTPASLADGALFSELDRSECYSKYTSTLRSY